MLLKVNAQCKSLTLPGRFEKIQTNIDGKDILSSDELKLLGLEIDNEMSFTSHIQSIFKKASKIAVLSRLKNIIPIIISMLNYTYIRLPYHLT